MLSALLCCASIDQQMCDFYRSMALTSVKHSTFSLVTLAGGEPGLQVCAIVRGSLRSGIPGQAAKVKGTSTPGSAW